MGAFTDPVEPSRMPRSPAKRSLDYTRRKARYYRNLRKRIAVGDPYVHHGSYAVWHAGCRCARCKGR